MIGFPEILLSILPELVLIAAWTTAVVFAVRMVRSGGGRPELFLLIGVCLMLAGAVSSVLVTIFFHTIIIQMAAGAGRMSIVQVMGFFGIFRACISLAGIVLMVIAFWKKFKGKQPATATE